MSTFSTNLKIELIGTGEQNGTWGTTTNSNFSNVFEQSIVGRVAVPFSNADVTLTATNTVANQDYRNFFLNCTGTNAAIRNLIVPTLNKTYIVENNTTGGFAIVVKTSAGTGITVPNGYKCAVYADGTNVVQTESYFPNLYVGTYGTAWNGPTIATSVGGTGLTTFTAANNALYSTSAGALAAGTLPVAAGGTGLVTLTTGYIPYGNGTGAYSSSANLFFTGSRLGINTASPLVTASFVGTDAILLPSGTTGQQPTGVAGYLRFNSTTSQFEGHNGTIWSSVGGATLSNDTSTATFLYPLFASATSGTALTVYTSNAKYNYKPSTGELQSQALIASNGIVLNNSTVSSSYTIATGNNAMSVGPITVASGQTVTVSSGQRWVII
jgi:hypothetical protein